MNKSRIKIAFHTLGCKLNFTETSTIARSFPEDKFEKVAPDKEADIYVINTCSVTEAADRKCRQAIKKFTHRSPESFIAVVGCYAQLKPGEISAIPGVDLVLGTSEKFDIVQYLGDSKRNSTAEIHSECLTREEHFTPSYSIGDRTRSFLKVQDGCDYGCAYCTVPLARGRSRNQEIRSVVEEAEAIAERGIKEIVITGVNTGDFGKSTGDSFAGLLKELIQVPGIERYRISSIEPNLLTDEIIELAAAGKKIMPHFHIPLQSGSDRILGQMRRRYNRELFEGRVRSVREKIPLAGIGADIIAGFPGESDQDFEDTFTFLTDMPISYLHVFTYSERPGTAAEKMQGKVPCAVKEVRSKRLISLSEKKHIEFCRMNTGKVAEVLFEGTRRRNMITGFTGNYIRVEQPWDAKLTGKIRKVILKDLIPDGHMSGEFID